MRVLMVNKFWYRRGGLERVMFDEIKWLEDSGHEVAHFSTRHPMNQASPWEEHFVPYLELGADGGLSARQKVVATGRMFWNREAAQRFDRLLRAFAPDIVHMHGIHRQLSPSVVYAAKRRGVPIVQTLHDYHPLCPCDTLLRAGLEICDPPRCSSSTAIACFRNRCTRGNAAASGLATAEAAWRYRVMKLDRNVDALIAPSHFLSRMLQTWIGRLPPVHVVPNAVQVREQSPPGDYFLYSGRLAVEKGVLTLVKAARKEGLPLVVAGDGPMRAQLETAAEGEVTFLGHVDGKTVDRYLAGARAAVVPSEWYENAPLSVLESMACGRPVVASNVGGIPELIRDRVDGLLVERGNVDSLAAAMKYLSAQPSEATAMGRRAQEQVVLLFSPARHLELLTLVYSDCVGSSLKRSGRGCS
jgi:glycosyltransferase involved in cell wall biosynthesis